MKICSRLHDRFRNLFTVMPTAHTCLFRFFSGGNFTSVKHRDEDFSESKTLPSIGIACLTSLQCAPIPHLFFRVAIPRVNFKPAAVVSIAECGNLPLPFAENDTQTVASSFSSTPLLFLSLSHAFSPLRCFWHGLKFEPIVSYRIYRGDHSDDMPSQPRV